MAATTNKQFAQGLAAFLHEQGRDDLASALAAERIEWFRLLDESSRVTEKVLSNLIDRVDQILGRYAHQEQNEP